LCVILSDLTVKMTVNWDITSCSWMNRFQCFRVTSFLHLLTLTNGGSMFHWNSCAGRSNYMASRHWWTFLKLWTTHHCVSGNHFY